MITDKLTCIQIALHAVIALGVGEVLMFSLNQVAPKKSGVVYVMCNAKLYRPKCVLTGLADSEPDSFELENQENNLLN